MTTPAGDERFVDDLLRGIDRPAPLGAAAEDRLLAELQEHLGLGPLDDDRSGNVSELTTLPIADPDRPEQRSRRTALPRLVAAAAVIVVIGVGLLLAGDRATVTEPAEPVPTTSTAPPTTTLTVLTDPSAACARFLATAGPVPLVGAPSIDELDALVGAFDVLRLDLEASNADLETEITSLRIVRGLFNQARLETEDERNTKGTLATARGSWEELTVPGSVIDGCR